MLEHLKTLFDRDLKKLTQEIAAYQYEPNLWRKEKAIPNSAGNLCLHLVGNLNTYLGANLAHTGYIRNRDEEFSLRDVPQQKLLEDVEKTRQVVSLALAGLQPEDLNRPYPYPVFDYAMTTGYFLVHLAMHLGYHLGQINYHRRLLDGPAN